MNDRLDNAGYAICVLSLLVLSLIAGVQFGREITAGPDQTVATPAPLQRPATADAALAGPLLAHHDDAQAPASRAVQ